VICNKKKEKKGGKEAEDGREECKADIEDRDTIYVDDMGGTRFDCLCYLVWCAPFRSLLCSLLLQQKYIFTFFDGDGQIGSEGLLISRSVSRSVSLSAIYPMS
jgi:hypothetical protein